MVLILRILLRPLRHAGLRTLADLPQARRTHVHVPTSGLHPLTGDMLIATDHLHSALAELVDTGHHTACIDQPGLWLSDSRADRDIAVRLCAGCQVIVECAAAAKEVHAHFGVWAARDYTPTPPTKPTDR